MGRLEDVQAYKAYREEHGFWGITVSEYARWSHKLPDVAMADICACLRTGSLVCMYDGLYYDPKSPALSCYVLEDMITYFRPDHFSYVSFEKMLFAYGAIQEPIVALTVATVGESGRYETREGVLQFTHIEIEDMFLLHKHILWSDKRQCYVATAYQAWKDLQQIDRNIGLVDLDVLEYAMERESSIPDPFCETAPLPRIAFPKKPKPMWD